MSKHLKVVVAYMKPDPNAIALDYHGEKVRPIRLILCGPFETSEDAFEWASTIWEDNRVFTIESLISPDKVRKE